MGLSVMEFVLGGFLLMYINVPGVVGISGFVLLAASLGAVVTFAFGLEAVSTLLQEIDESR